MESLYRIRLESAFKDVYTVGLRLYTTGFHINDERPVGVSGHSLNKFASSSLPFPVDNSP